MSVIVKNMEMPKNCQQCPFIHSSWGVDFYCELAKDYQDFNFTQSHRMPSCPLVEIPTPHGRLGDLDALYAEISNGNKAYNGFDGYDGKYPNIGNVDDCLDAIKYADTVIEAEGETWKVSTHLE